MINEPVKTAKAYKGMAMEGPIASWYAKNTLKDVKRHKLMAAQLAPKIPAGGRVLEVAPGPGYFCIELAQLGDYKITGLDISKSFVEISQKNAAAAGIAAVFRQGDAAHMPFEAGTFDFIFCQAAFKNFSQPVGAIAEMHRVLRPSGLAVISDLRSDADRDGIEREIKGMGLDPINEFLTRWTFQAMLLKSAYSVAEMKAMAAQTPFGKCKVDVGDIGFMVWLEK
jgi:ubiquinone/menaquinone biosynthesis C-methylase UbiE